MNTLGSDRIRDETLFIARILLVVLFVIFGWRKLTDYAGTVSYMAESGAPIPGLAALVAIVVEVFFAAAVVLGVWTRLMAILLALYTLASALIAHRYWAMTGADAAANMINFYKNISIMGGFFLLYVTGPGRYSVDAKFRSA
jgi:putative oxidoreductase